VLRRARNRPDVRPSRSVRKYARNRILLAVDFLNWLGERNLTLSTATQRDVDVWLLEGSVNRYRLRGFLLWTQARSLTTDLTVPWLGRGEPNDMLNTDERWQLLRRCLHDDHVSLRLRAAGALVLLFGQTPARVVQLTRADLTSRGGQAYLNLGRQPVILPPRLGVLLNELADQVPAGRRPRVEDSDGDHQWLFPGTYPGQHADPERISTLLNGELGIFIRPARNTALCALAEDLPAPVLAELLDLHINTAVRWTALVKRDWSDFVAARTDDPNLSAADNTLQRR